ncbi:hypothetical protein EMCRGX_G035039 [Ephydatia muelleri]
MYATATTQILNLSNLLKGSDIKRTEENRAAKRSDIKRTSRRTALLKGSDIKRTSRRTVLLKGSDIKRTSRRTALLKGRNTRTIQLPLRHLKGIGIGMTPLSDWLNMLPRGSGIAGVTELPLPPKATAPATAARYIAAPLPSAASSSCSTAPAEQSCPYRHQQQQQHCPHCQQQSCPHLQQQSKQEHRHYLHQPHHRHQYWHQCPVPPPPLHLLPPWPLPPPPAWLPWPEPGRRGHRRGWGRGRGQGGTEPFRT